MWRELKKNTKIYVHFFHIVMLCMMGVCIANITFEINHMQDIARVINYAGSVRGNTQRMVKRELAHIPSDLLLVATDRWIEELDGKPGSNELIRLADPVYLDNLHDLKLIWIDIKASVSKYRQTGQTTDLMTLSELHFVKSDAMVKAAEAYSAERGRYIYQMEIALVIMILILFAEVLIRTTKEVLLIKKNEQLNEMVFTDPKTQIPNRAACVAQINEHDTAEKCRHHGCIMFDLNNLKKTNDTLGHEFGDILIARFAYILNQHLPPSIFLGRWGGDEFITIFATATQGILDNYVQMVQKSVENYNETNGKLTLSFAYGYGISDKNNLLNMRELLIVADKNMYKRKRSMKMNPFIP